MSVSKGNLPKLNVCAPLNFFNSVYRKSTHLADSCIGINRTQLWCMVVHITVFSRKSICRNVLRYATSKIHWKTQGIPRCLNHTILWSRNIADLPPANELLSYVCYGGAVEGNSFCPIRSICSLRYIYPWSMLTAINWNMVPVFWASQVTLPHCTWQSLYYWHWLHSFYCTVRSNEKKS